MVVVEDIQNITFSREFPPGNRLVISFSCSITTHSILFPFQPLADFWLFRQLIFKQLNKISNCYNKNCFLCGSNRLGFLAKYLFTHMKSVMKPHFNIKKVYKYLKKTHAYGCNKSIPGKTREILHRRVSAAVRDCIQSKKPCTSGVPCYQFGKRCTSGVPDVPCNQSTGEKVSYIFPDFHPRFKQSDNFVNYSPETFKYYETKLRVKRDECKNNRTESVQFENTNAEDVEIIEAEKNGQFENNNLENVEIIDAEDDQFEIANAEYIEIIEAENIYPVHYKEFLAQMSKLNCLMHQDISLLDQDKHDKDQRPDPKDEKEK
ncbi:17544_t:CDS:1 [Cetraspora pellucida]|uniref:17544_t:CDS:1 n=1 Tax=Cetraspora pellucida TaxID=1433469 RepID=A0A9N9JAY3_9GLOM|nr:17544_t:CDS:1 [Cetraspora pellucida]